MQHQIAEDNGVKHSLHFLPKFYNGSTAEQHGLINRISNKKIPEIHFQNIFYSTK